jgi:hypothetical protein
MAAENALTRLLQGRAQAGPDLCVYLSERDGANLHDQEARGLLGPSPEPKELAMPESDFRRSTGVLCWGSLVIFLVGVRLAAGQPPDPRDPGSFPTSSALIDEGCSYDLDGSSLEWTDPTFGFTTPTTVEFGDHDYAGSDTRCPGSPAKLVDMKVRVYFPGTGGVVASGGPFPLVVFLHGQQLPNIAGFEGYEYLGELLASHGFIVASIDGRSLLDSTIKSRGEHIREHLRRFVARNEPGSGSFLSEQLDLSKVTLVGHSRGGDAVVAAWEWQRVDPDAGYTIAAIVAIAPVQFFGGVSGEPSFISHVRDVAYQIIHGSHDCDVSDFQGYRQYDRAADIRAVGETLKSMVYLKDANHNFFNTIWESLEGSDCGSGDVLDAAVARDVAKVYVHAFLQTKIKGRDDFRGYLAGEIPNPVAGSTVSIDLQAPWSEFTPLDHFEELPGDPHDKTRNSQGGPVVATDMTYEEERFAVTEPAPRDTYRGETHAAYLLWDTSAARFVSRFPRLALRRGLDPKSFQATFYNLADLRGSSFTRPYTEPIDFQRSCFGESWPFTGCELVDELDDGNDYSVRWQGRLMAPADGDYTFILASVDDGARLYVDGVETVDKGWYWPAPDRRPSPQTVSLAAGWHDITVDYEQRVRFVASLQVRWDGPGFVDEVIPLGSLAGMTHLSFRVGQIHRPSGSPNPPDANQDFSLLVRLGNFVRSVRVSDFAPIHPPFPALDGRTKTVMSVVRVPLSEFRAAPTPILGIEFFFDQVGSGEIVVDDLRFTR